MDCGVQCVVTHGTLGMPQLCADNSDMKDVSFAAPPLTIKLLIPLTKQCLPNYLRSSKLKSMHSEEMLNNSTHIISLVIMYGYSLTVRRKRCVLIPSYKYTGQLAIAS